LVKKLDHYTTIALTAHAKKRATQRGVKTNTLNDIVRFGRKTYQSGAIYYSIGRKEIQKHQKRLPAIKNMNGIHVVVSLTGKILTVFKNKDFAKIRHC